MGPPVIGRPSGISRGPLVVDGRRGGGGPGAWWGEVLPRRGGRRACLRRARPLPCRRLLPRRGHRCGRRDLAADPGRRASTSGEHGRRGVRAVGRRDRRRRPATPKGRLRDDANALRFVEVVVNGPKTWSLRRGPAPGDLRGTGRGAGQGRHARSSAGSPQHATTRVGPRGRQVQVPVEQIEAAVIRHYTSRAGDPHRHLHLQINARVFAAGAWRGTALGRGPGQHRGDQRHRARRRRAPTPSFRAALAAHGFTLDPRPARSASSRRTSARSVHGPRRSAATSTGYEAAWRGEHPGEEPGPRLREAWDRRAWAEARPDKVVPSDGRELVDRWNDELRELGYRDPADAVRPRRDADRGGSTATPPPTWCVSHARREAVGVERRRHPRRDRGAPRRRRPASPTRPCGSSWPRTSPPAPSARCAALLDRDDVPEHVRSLTSPQVLDVEADLIARLAARRRSGRPDGPASAGAACVRIDAAQAARRRGAGRRRRAASWSKAPPVPARPPPCGRTATAARPRQGHRLVVVTPDAEGRRGRRRRDRRRRRSPPPG